jgi:arginine decarboxylase
MEPIRVATGTGTGPTELAAYDAALGDAGAGDYNLVRLSSVVPAEARVAVVGTLPELGAVGDRLTVVEAAGVGSEAASAALAWGRRSAPDDPERTGAGLFFEAGDADGAGERSPRVEAETGLTAGARRRGWSLDERDCVTAGADADGEAHVAAVALAAYGSAEPVL